MNARPGLRARSALGRADLLHIWAAHGDAALAIAADALGYASTPRTQQVVVTAGEPASLFGSALARPEPPPLPARPRELPALPLFHLVDYQQRAGDPARPPGSGPPAPAWLQHAKLLSNDQRPAPASFRQPQRQALTRWSRLWPFLCQALGGRMPAREPDWPRLLARLTRGEILRTLPRRSRPGWSERIVILTDYSRPTQPVHADFNALQHALEKRRGRHGVERWIVAGNPGRELHARRPGQSVSQRWPLPAAQTPLLILGDGGQLERDPAARQGWNDFAGRLRAAGCRPLLLCPLPAALQPPGARDHLTSVAWDRHSRLRPTRARPQDAADAEARAQRAVSTLLTLLAPAVVIDADLLRALRYLLPADEADVLAEIRLWQHPDVDAGALAGQFAGRAAIAAYQDAFARLPEALRDAAAACLLAQHRGLPDSVRHAEALACLRLAPAAVPAPLAAAAQTWQADIAHTACERQGPALHAWFARHAARQSDAALAASPPLAAHWALAQGTRLAAGETVELPPGVHPENVAYFFHRLTSASGAPARQRATLRQRGDELWLEASAADNPPGGCPLGEVMLADSGLWVEVTRHGDAETGADIDRRHLAAHPLPQRLARLTREVDTLRVHGESLALTVAALRKPAWALAIAHDESGLYAEVVWRGQRCRLDWQPPRTADADRDIGRNGGAWRSAGPLGVDRYGLYAEVAVGDARQRFRWMAPGTFLMGSPADEAERYDDEVQHEVTLTRGYWLADTACTQALWQAVMGNNPSRFADDSRRPVEQVSWNDVQGFLKELNRRVPGLSARLPSEAEWEYACRAGTTTPFSFGADITPEQVNYDGNYPYAGGRRGRNRQQTVAVGTLPANAWGLYEMHGNVWEWCADEYGEYPTTPQREPRGAAPGAGRVLRGGSWRNVGGYVRSAVRNRNEPDFRFVTFGFRLALGLPGPAEPAGKGGGYSPAEPARETLAPAERGPGSGVPPGTGGTPGSPDSLLQRSKEWLKRKLKGS